MGIDWSSPDTYGWIFLGTIGGAVLGMMVLGLMMSLIDHLRRSSQEKPLHPLVTNIVRSMNEEPDSWKFDDYYMMRRGVTVSIRWPCDPPGAVHGVALSRRERRAILAAFESWLVRQVAPKMEEGAARNASHTPLGPSLGDIKGNHAERPWPGVKAKGGPVPYKPREPDDDKLG
jgi:hypothetical protein